MTARRIRLVPDLVAAGGMLCLLAVVHARAIVTDSSFFERDILGYIFPQIEAFVRSVAEGAPPLWSPFFSFGIPLLADSGHQAAYPLTWLNLLMSPARYYKVFVLVHGWAAGFGLYLLARAWGLAPFPAFAAGGSFLASGPLLSAVNLNHHYAGAAWMPWALLALEKALCDSRWRFKLLLGGAAAGQLLAGSGDMLFMTGLAALGRVGFHFYGCFRGQLLWPGVRRVAGVAGVAIVFGACASAVQWIPTIEAVRGGARLSQSATSSSYWSLHPVSLIDVIAPRLVADLPMSPALRQAVFEGREPLLASVYLGSPLVLLMVLGALQPGSKGRRGAMAGLLFFGLMALGRHTPLYLLLQNIWPVGMFRYPVKYAIPAALFAALLAGGGIETWRCCGTGKRSFRALAVVALVLGLAMVLGAVWVSQDADRFSVLLDTSSGSAPSLLLPVIDKLRTAGAWALAAAGLALLRSRYDRSPRLLTVAIALLSLGGLILANQSVYRLAPRSLVSHRPELATEIISAAAEPRIFSFSYRSDWLNQQLVRVPEGWRPEWAWALGSVDRLQPPAASRFRIAGSYDGHFTGLAPLSMGELTRLTRASEGLPLGIKLLQMGAVTHVVALHPFAFRDLPQIAEIPSVYRPTVRLYQVPSPLPRAYVVEGVRVIDGPAAYSTIASDVFDPRREVLLPRGTPHLAAAGFEASAAIVHRRSDRLELEAFANRSGMLVVVEAHDPGWQARVDGRPEEILVANVHFRAVPIGPGRHRVEMIYRPTGPLLGAAISAVAWAFLAATGVRVLLTRGRFDPGRRPPIASCW